MEHGRKYVVVVLMMAAAGYAAHQFRRAPSERIVPIAASSSQLTTSERSAIAPQLPKPRGQLPVTALADPERVPTASPRPEKPQPQAAPKPEVKAPPKPEIRAPSPDKPSSAQRNAEKPGDRVAGQKKGNTKNSEVKKPEGKKPGDVKGSKENTAEGRPSTVARAAPKAVPEDLRPITPPKAPTLAKMEKPAFEQPALNADSDPPPSLADRYQPVLSRLDLANPHDDDPLSPSPERQLRAAHRVTPPPAAADQERRHRVVDGDSLPQLAQRYLGDQRRYLEILCANRAILKDPEVLPLGIELIIPAGDHDVGAAVAATPAKSTITAAASPIPPESPSSTAAPEASPVKPPREPSVTSRPQNTGNPPSVPGPATKAPRAASETPVPIPWDSLPPPKRG